MKTLSSCIILAAVTLIQATAQTRERAEQSRDPFKVAPKAYKLEFENEWVRVTRVRYEARETIPEHYHTERPSAYVYLNDAGKVIFKHKDLPYGDIPRAPVKAGTFRVYRGVKEVHAVENPSDTASEFLRVEFKTEPLEQESLRGKYHREPVASGASTRKIQFENKQIRVTRMVIAARQAVDVSTSATEPALLVSLTQSKLKKGGAKTDVRIGKTIWLASGQPNQIENAGEVPAELLRFDFKTKPFHDATDRTETHDHKHANNRLLKRNPTNAVGGLFSYSAYNAKAAGFPSRIPPTGKLVDRS